jgi:tRNA(Ile)-lysidine synthase
MKRAFFRFLQENQWSDPDYSFLLALSGGLDSMVMAHLFAQCRLQFGIGHINHGLRKEDSDADEALVREYAQSLGVPFYSTRIPTKSEAEQTKGSLQEVARDLRYDWLEATRKAEGYHFICTAHHADDALETLLLNLVKGTGLRGIAGIPVQRGKIIRPLLFATREQLAQYQEEQQVPFREDQSNHSLKYDRNRIRWEVIPVLTKLNPSLSSTSARTLDNLRGNLELYEMFLQSLRDQLVTKETDHWKIALPPLRRLPAPRTVLYELLAPFGLNKDQVQDLWVAQETGHPGKTFYSEYFEVLLDRDTIFIRRVNSLPEIALELHADESHYLLPNGRLEVQRLEMPPANFPEDPHLAILDSDKLTFPLLWRHWKPGDYFHPLGMDGKRKKVQDFFTDQKMNRFEKQKVWILESKGQIAWIAGHRIDENFKITPSTKSCWFFRYFPTIETEKKS